MNVLVCNNACCQLMEQTRDIILFARTDGKIVDANRAATEASGYSVKEMQQLSLGDLLVSEELKPVIEQLFEAAKSGTLLRMAYKRKNGDLLPVETRPLLLREDVLVCIIRDISEQVAYENVMRQTEQNCSPPTKSWLQPTWNLRHQSTCCASSMKR